MEILGPRICISTVSSIQLPNTSAKCKHFASFLHKKITEREKICSFLHMFFLLPSPVSQPLPARFPQLPPLLLSCLLLFSLSLLRPPPVLTQTPDFSVEELQRRLLRRRREEKGSSRGRRGKTALEGKRWKEEEEGKENGDQFSRSFLGRSPESRKGFLCRMQQRPRREALLGKRGFFEQPPLPKKGREKRNSSRQKSAPAFSSFLPLIVSQERKIKIPPTKKGKNSGVYSTEKIVGEAGEGKKRRRGRMKPKTPSFLSSPRRRPFHKRAAAPKFFSPPSSNFFSFEEAAELLLFMGTRRRFFVRDDSNAQKGN